MGPLHKSKANLHLCNVIRGFWFRAETDQKEKERVKMRQKKKKERKKEQARHTERGVIGEGMKRQE